MIEARDASLVDQANWIAKTFVERRDAVAFQTRNGWQRGRKVDGETVDVPLTRSLLEQHLRGEVTLGHYLLGQGGYARVLIFDLDIAKAKPGEPDMRAAFLENDPAFAPLLRCHMNQVAFPLARKAEAMTGARAYVTSSGSKGVHVSIPMAEVTPKSARAMATEILGSFDLNPFEEGRGNNFWSVRGIPLEIEVFPKQDATSQGGYGNLVRLPLGVNLKSGKRGAFLWDGQPTVLTEFPIEGILANLRQWTESSNR